MTSLPDLLQQGTAHAWLFVPSAILLGALHGLEPGHSKTMMAAFIVAVRGTVTQAVLLGLAATLSHTAVVWAIALAGQYLGQEWGGEASEPYFQLASAVLIVGIAAWMAWRTWREQHHDHHHHHDEAKHVPTRNGLLTLEVFEDGVPPRWRVRAERGALPATGDLTVETVRPDGGRQTFAFANGGEFLESLEEIPKPHAFTARLHMDGPSGVEVHEVAFEEHNHDHMNLGDEDDAHARAHAEDIRRRFSGRQVTTGQIVMFGLTGGLIPCPAAITVLLLCIQLKQFGLGFALVVCFSVGLALTMVSAGVIAALSVRHVATRWSGFSAFARRAPYASAALIVLVGLYTGWLGWEGIRHSHQDHAATWVTSIPA
ncbi:MULTISPECIES: nickel/cobalt efflux transporter [Methylobacterium]|uniref:Nickel/cobalt efflux system n=2 Tax=Methylobacterium TaxID=407 RepID=A0A089Q7Y3_9HYPH|nr:MULTISPECIES: nickel/cobalt efflux transporter [Methylobacterium]ACB24520.1 high-affinity nickel-transporter [Methylobacterium radiotolerans JCM 2831]AIQ90694.1 High-affinity nickel-transporter [Methylobacterium oryzae CBMB20]GEN01315.1 nickel/cobalt efflux system [Methylobacterium radiotolerans]